MVVNLVKRLNVLVNALFGVQLEGLPLLDLEVVVQFDLQVQLTANDSVVSDKQNGVSWVSNLVVSLSATDEVLNEASLGSSTRHAFEDTFLKFDETVAIV